MRNFISCCFFIALIIAVSCECEDDIAQYIDVETIIKDPIEIKTGDRMQCIATKSKNIESRTRQVNIHTVEAHDIGAYHYLQVPEKCFSFKVSAPEGIHLALSSTPYIPHDNRLEVILDWAEVKHSVIRRATPQFHILKNYNKSTVLSDTEYRGFWMKWFDNQLLEIGHESETEPFLYHRFPEPLNVNYIGYMSFFVKGKWLIDIEPKCPGMKKNHTKIITSKCFLQNFVDQRKNLN